ncbi:hypothetical protein ACFL5Q_06185 [Planctomycetota bacterium]
MVRRMILGICLVCLCASLASADPVVLGKVRDLFPSDDSEIADADGAATLIWKPWKDNPDVGTAEISVVIKGFEPNTPYYVRFLGAWGVGEPIVTNDKGKGSFRISDPESLNPELYLDFFKMSELYPDEYAELIAQLPAELTPNPAELHGVRALITVFINEDLDQTWDPGERGAVGFVQ